MLRITTSETNGGEPLLILEGRLVGPWVDELQAVTNAMLSPRVRVHVDLSHVHFVDAQGLVLLHDLQAQRAVLRAVTPFVQELLAINQGD